MKRLLALIESGRAVRFDNRLPPITKPRGHLFTLTCDCADCERTWHR